MKNPTTWQAQTRTAIVCDASSCFYSFGGGRKALNTEIEALVSATGESWLRRKLPQCQSAGVQRNAASNFRKRRHTVRETQAHPASCCFAERAHTPTPSTGHPQSNTHASQGKENKTAATKIRGTRTRTRHAHCTQPKHTRAVLTSPIPSGTSTASGKLATPAPKEAARHSCGGQWAAQARQGG